MTERELHKLRRQDLLQLLLLQSRETAQQQTALSELEEEAALLRESNERLKGKLDEKDSQLDRLKRRLDQKDDTIRALQAELKSLRNQKLPLMRGEDGGRTVPLDLDELLNAARKAMERCLYESSGAEAERAIIREPAPAEAAPHPDETGLTEAEADPVRDEEIPAERPAEEPEPPSPEEAHSNVESGRGSLFKEGSIWQRRKLKSRQSNYWKQS